MPVQPTTQFELFMYNMTLIQAACLFNMMSGSGDYTPGDAVGDLATAKAYIDAMWSSLPSTIY